METPATIEVMGARAARAGARVAVVAWVVAATFYFYQYAMRSAPAVMMPQLSEAFGLSALGVASVVGVFYYGYALFSPVAGAAMDRLGPKLQLPAAAAVFGLGAFLFSTGNVEAASVGRFLQGVAGAFAAVGALYIASNYFPASKAATFVGATQMFGMAGGSAGQFAVGPMIGGGLAWTSFWAGMALVGLILGVTLFLLLPRMERRNQPDNWMKAALGAFKVVFRNPQSILCGLIAGLLFIPTTIFDMVWGVRFLQEGHGLDYGTAVMRSATVPLGWIIGCPLLGFISDRLGRRKPVIVGGACLLLGCMAWILYGPAGVLPPYVLGLVAGVASGAAMLPYTVIKEANPPQYGGTATGVINFLNFTFSALLGPAFAVMLQRASGGDARLERGDFQTAFTPMLYGVALAILLALLLKETGAAARATPVGMTEETWR
jgi:MFS family permease